MKIFIIGSDVFSMINFRKELIIRLVELKFDVYCLANNYDENYCNKIQKLGATPLYCALNSKGLNPFKDIMALYNLIKIIKKYNPDIVFSFFAKPVIFSAIASKIAKIKRIVGMLEGLGTPFTECKNGQSLKVKVIKFIEILLYKFSLPLLDKIIFLNNDDKKELIDKYKIDIKSIEILGAIGVDLDKFSYNEAPINQVSFIFVGRFLIQKGIFEYLEASKIVKLKYPNSKFYILGTFDEKNPFSLKKEELEQYLKNDIVEYLGFVDDINKWIIKSSIFVLPSYREGFPRSTQEAMAIGRAVITTNTAGCKETVKNGINGFLIPLFNAEILAQKMQYFIQNPQKINEMGKESRKIAEEKFDIRRINERLIRLIINT